MAVFSLIVLSQDTHMMASSHTQLAQRGTIQGEPVRGDRLDADALISQQLAHEPQCSDTVPALLDQNVEHDAAPLASGMWTAYEKRAVRIDAKVMQPGSNWLQIHAICLLI